MDDALGARRHDRKPDLLQGVGGRVHELLHAGRHVGDALLPSGGDDVALRERPAEEGALQRLHRSLQAQVLLRRREDDARRRLRFDPAHLDEVARADAGIRPLQAVDAQHVDALVLGIGTDRTRGRRLLADNLDHVALADAEGRHQAARQMRKAPARILRACIRHLDLALRCIAIGHDLSFCRRKWSSKRAR